MSTMQELPYVKPTIVFDMDDTLCDWIGDVLVVIEQATGRKFTEESFANGLWLEDVMTKEECDAVFPRIFNQQFYLALRPTPLALQMAASTEAKALRKEYNFHIVTARADVLPKIALRVTEMWLHSRNVRVRGVTITAPKASKVMSAAASSLVFVDDSTTVAREAIMRGKKALLIEKPWNKRLELSDEQSKHLIRLPSDDVIQYLADTLL